MISSGFELTPPSLLIMNSATLFLMHGIPQEVKEYEPVIDKVERSAIGAEVPVKGNICWWIYFGPNVFKSVQMNEYYSFSPTLPPLQAPRSFCALCLASRGRHFSVMSSG